MDLPSFRADEMPENAWEQREKFCAALLEVFETLLSQENYKDITLNSINLAVIGFLYRHTEGIEDFQLVSNQFILSLQRTVASWCEGGDEEDEL